MRNILSFDKLLVFAGITVDENDRTYWMTMETFFYVIPNPFPDDGNTGTNGDF